MTIVVTKLGSELHVGDVIEVWWKPGRDRIDTLDPYRGPLAHIFLHGARIAGFALSNLGMTIEHNMNYRVVTH